MANPYETPQAPVRDISNNGADEVVYVGFWRRVLASIIDSIILLAITYPVLYAVYGEKYFTKTQWLAGSMDFLLSYIFPMLAVILFWIYKSATPGKMAVGAKIVDAKTGGKPSKGQMIGRYFSYYLSMIPLFLGYFWIAWDPKKQAWHDKLAGTVVIRK